MGFLKLFIFTGFVYNVLFLSLSVSVSDVCISLPTFVIPAENHKNLIGTVLIFNFLAVQAQTSAGLKVSESVLSCWLVWVVRQSEFDPGKVNKFLFLSPHPYRLQGLSKFLSTW
jgi:hypothetical protein